MKRYIIILLLIPFISNNIFGQLTKEACLERGKQDYENGYLFSALLHLDQAIGIDSLYADAYYYKALTYMKGFKGDYYAPIINNCKKCISLDSNKNYWQAYYHLAYYYYFRDSSYIKYFDKALFFNPGNIEIVFNLCDANRKWKNSKAELYNCNLAISMEPKNAKAYLLRARYYYNIDKSLALKDLKKARRLDRKNPEIYNKLGDLYYYMSSKNKKYNYCKYYRKAFELNPNYYYYDMKKCGVNYDSINQ